MSPLLTISHVIELPKIKDPRGNLTFIEACNHLPFEFKRIFYLYDVPSGADRGGHALIHCHQFLIAMSGSFDVILKDGHTEQRINLSRPNIGLHIPPGIWRELENFSSCAACVVLASHLYSEDDYIRDYGDFLRSINDDSSQA